MFFTKIWLVTPTRIMKYKSRVVKLNSPIFLILQIICKKIKMSMFLVYPGPLEVNYKQCMLIRFHYNQSLISLQYSLHEVFTILKTTYSYSLSNSIIFYTKFQPYLCYMAIIGRYEVAFMDIFQNAFPRWVIIIFFKVQRSYFGWTVQLVEDLLT